MSRCLLLLLLLQVSMKLKLAQMWDHNGTNMVTIGFMYRDYKVLIDLEGSEQDILTGALGHSLRHTLTVAVMIRALENLLPSCLWGGIVASHWLAFTVPADAPHAVRTVTLQGKKLKEKKMAQHHAWRFEDGAYIETTWDRFKAGLGNTVIVQTGAYDDTVRKGRLCACMHVHVALGCADQAM